MTTKNAADEFQRFMQARKSEAAIVDVHAPSGFVYKFTKPSKFSLLFGMGELPQIAASKAAERWTEEGIIQGIESGDADTLKLAQMAFSVRDRVLALSYSPKLVAGTANAANGEVSTDDVPDDDLTYLFQWVQAGGDTSLMLNNFPVESQQRPMAQPNRKARRATAK